MMTAGQGGGPYGEPTGEPGQPQGWNAPPSPPPSPPPYGQQYPGQQNPGQQSPGQQYPGYAPAPSAPTGYGAPAPVERPITVRAGIGAFVGSIVLSVVAQVITMFNWDTLLDPAMDASLGELSDEEAEMAAGIAGSLGVFGLVVGLLFTAVFALFVWFAWRGHNWARIVLWVLAGLGLLGALAGFGLGSYPMPVLAALGVFEMIFDVAAVVLLALKPSNEWFRFRSWQRATGQG